jgi:putative cardiolipin synthase
MSNLSNHLVFGACMILLCGCTSINYEYPRPESHAYIDTRATYLGQYLEEKTNGRQDGESGFLLLSNGIDALAARLLFADKAARSIDVQYYLIKDDVVGNIFVQSLLDAADRGVRVRLLLDDIFTGGFDAGLIALNSHPHIEIRIFNPFNRGLFGRAVSAATSFSRINRRLHNKSFTVDNQITLIGGRNIANEYFGASTDVNFRDLDVVGIGPIVADVSNMFDLYWNHETAQPVGAFIKPLKDVEAELRRIRVDLASNVSTIRTTVYADAVIKQIGDYLDETAPFRWAPYQLVYDSPVKGVRDIKRAESITLPLAETLGSAQQEVVIISPYFVPQKTGVEGLIELRQRNVEVSVITNSLAANNQTLVHGGYMPARKPLLAGGVKIYEIRPDMSVSGSEFVASDRSKRATLHTKAFIVDRKKIFIGSFNFDPRSANLNTELGVIIEDEQLGSVLADQIEMQLPTTTYTLTLSEDRSLRWLTVGDSGDLVFDKEPESTWVQRLTARIARFLPIHGQL